MRPILRLQDALTRLAFFVGAGALAAIVLIYAYEVVSRYAFGAPTLWASDFVSFLLLISVFCAGPWLTREGGHVAVTILPDLASVRRPLILRMGFLVAAATCLWATWLCLGEVRHLAERGTATLTTVRIPKWILMAFIAYGVGNSGLYFLRLACGADLSGTETPEEVTHG
ncbi:MAG: TRAP transporter small permease [Limimaricola soesokkakensis]|uniref:TRAP transporter small permease n=1 Tax=Limimaricola TaxID=2211638 RepID=UPI002AC94BBE|nr:TRAP transporter small permease subunit [Limimaricola variabilis]WPY96847.1 TRAP transporter small permease subunit [Limimaricola variabilis]